jgi:hypothetical protein
LKREWNWLAVFIAKDSNDIARATLADVAPELPDVELELRDSCLGLWGAVERESGRFKDALNMMRQAVNAAELLGNLDSARCYHELAVTLKDIFISERIDVLADEAKFILRKLCMCARRWVTIELLPQCKTI